MVPDLHNWIVVARDARGAISQWKCYRCSANAYGENAPVENGCTGEPINRLHDTTGAPVLNRTHTRDNF